MPPDSTVAKIAARMEKFEAAASVAGTPAGSRRDGGDFEDLCLGFWDAVGDVCKAAGCHVEGSTVKGGRMWNGLRFEKRTLWLPTRNAESEVLVPRAAEWLKTVYRVPELVGQYPGTQQAVDDFSPARGPFAGASYPNIYAGLSTGFDGAIIFVEDDTLVRKLLLEYKTAKSSGNKQIDGNAHERLSFQVMQYLEVATRYPSARFRVLANGAFVKYKNKYHVSFKIQAQRLRCFAWFDMNFACTAEEFVALAQECISWLLKGSLAE